MEDVSMDPIDKLKARIEKLIEQERSRLEKESDRYLEKMRDTESLYGFGGPYMRQQKAYEDREAELRELNNFERQFHDIKRTKRSFWYPIGCNSCGTISLSNRKPFDEWHECPVCRQMIYMTDVKPENLEIVDNGETWLDLLREREEN